MQIAGILISSNKEKNMHCGNSCPFYVRVEDKSFHQSSFKQFRSYCKLGGATDLNNCSIERMRIEKMRELLGLAGEE